MVKDNEFRNLLDYLENQNVDAKSTLPEKKVDKKPKPKTTIETKVEPPPKKEEKPKKESTSDKVKRIIEESREDILDFPQDSKIKSDGFDTIKFESLMRSRLIDDAKKLQSYERPYISVNELCECIRKSYYFRKKTPVDLSKQYKFSYLLLINHVGDAVHECIQSLYDFTEVEKTIVSEKYKVKGRIDALKEKFLIEIKTIDPRKFKGKYIEKHYKQGLIYAYILNTEYNYNIETITIVYIPRDLKKAYPFDLSVNNKRAERLLDGAEVLLNAIQKNVAPDPLGAELEQCNYCQYRKLCQNDPSEIDIPFLKGKEKKSDSVFML